MIRHANRALPTFYFKLKGLIMLNIRNVFWLVIRVFTYLPSMCTTVLHLLALEIKLKGHFKYFVTNIQFTVYKNKISIENYLHLT